MSVQGGEPIIVESKKIVVDEHDFHTGVKQAIKDVRSTLFVLFDSKWDYDGVVWDTYSCTSVLHEKESVSYFFHQVMRIKILFYPVLTHFLFIYHLSLF